MHNITTKFLKFFVGSLVFVGTFLYVFVTPGIEDEKSILSYNLTYKVVPHINYVGEEIVLNDSNINANVIDTFTGTMTAYGPDCVGCIGVTASGYKVAEKVNGVMQSITTTYLDDEFGELRIFAAATNKFPFGTVMRVSGDRIDGFITGIVLDRGGAMNNAYAEGEILVDLLFETEKSSEVYEFGRQRNLKFEVLRYGK